MESESVITPERPQRTPLLNGVILATIGIGASIVWSIVWLFVLRAVPFGLSLGFEAKSLVFTLQAVGAVGVLLSGPIAALVARSVGKRFFDVRDFRSIAFIATILWGAVLFIPDIGPLLKSHPEEYARSLGVLLVARLIVDAVAILLFFTTLRRG